MFVAYDKDYNRCYAEECEKSKDYYCPICEEKVQLRKGNIRKAHFAHLKDTECPYDDRDNKSEWHICMQEYFPREMREHLFKDEKTGECHIADVYVPEKDTVIEFQHSPILSEEFAARTEFYTRIGKRIVWVFDESTQKPKEGDLGRLRPCGGICNVFPHNMGYTFKWLRSPRKCLRSFVAVVYQKDYRNYAVCFFSGVEKGDCLHKIIGQFNGYDYVITSVHTIQMHENMDVEEFFVPEIYWLSQPEWKPIMDKARANHRGKVSIVNPIKPRKTFYRRGRRF